MYISAKFGLTYDMLSDPNLGQVMAIAINSPFRYGWLTKN